MSFYSKKNLSLFFKEVKECRFVCVLTFILAACSIIYELLMAQTISFLAANTVVWYSVTVGLFLMGMGLGSFLSRRLSSRFNTWTVLFVIEILLSFSGAVVVLVLHFAHTVSSYFHLSGLDLITIVIFFPVCFLVIIWVGILTGIELPLLIDLATKKSEKANASVIIGIDYIGSLFGACSFPLLLFPNLELLTIGIGTALVNTTAAFFVALYGEKDESYWISLTKTVSATLTVIVLFSLMEKNPRIQQYFLQNYYYYIEKSESLTTLLESSTNLPEVKRHFSPYQKIDLVSDPTETVSDILYPAYSRKFREPEEKKNLQNKWFLFLNGDFQVYSAVEEIYHEYFAHVPIIKSGRIPQKVLVLGGGDGLLIRELLKYKKVESIKHIDIDHTLIELAKTNEDLLRMNKCSLLSKRVNTLIADGYYFVRWTKEKFDAIYIDFPSPSDYNLSKLYSREFFSFVGKRVKENGFVVFDASGIGSLTFPNEHGKQYVDNDDWLIYYHTTKAAGFRTILPYLTTLEIDSARAYQALGQEEIEIPLSQEITRIVTNATDPKIKQAIMQGVVKAAYRSIIVDHMMGLQQGFMILGTKKNMFTAPYREQDLNLKVLNRNRFQLAFAQQFPKSKEINWELVNSIMRPTFPSTPLWLPRYSS